MLRRIDAWLLDRSDALLQWAWTEHGVTKTHVTRTIVMIAVVFDVLNIRASDAIVTMSAGLILQAWLTADPDLYMACREIVLYAYAYALAARPPVGPRRRKYSACAAPSNA